MPVEHGLSLPETELDKLRHLKERLVGEDRLKFNIGRLCLSYVRFRVYVEAITSAEASLPERACQSIEFVDGILKHCLANTFTSILRTENPDLIGYATLLLEQQRGFLNGDLDYLTFPIPFSHGMDIQGLLWSNPEAETRKPESWR